MKNFTEYLTESVKQYPFRVKIAGTVTAEKEEAMKGLLGRYTVSEKLEKVKKSTTPVQALPLDFPQVRNCEVNIYEFIFVLMFFNISSKTREIHGSKIKDNKNHHGKTG